MLDVQQQLSTKTASEMTTRDDKFGDEDESENKNFEDDDQRGGGSLTSDVDGRGPLFIPRSHVEMSLLEGDGTERRRDSALCSLDLHRRFFNESSVVSGRTTGHKPHDTRSAPTATIDLRLVRAVCFSCHVVFICSSLFCSAKEFGTLGGKSIAHAPAAINDYRAMRPEMQKDARDGDGEGAGVGSDLEPSTSFSSRTSLPSSTEPFSDVFLKTDGGDDKASMNKATVPTKTSGVNFPELWRMYQKQMKKHDWEEAITLSLLEKNSKQKEKKHKAALGTLAALNIAIWSVRFFNSMVVKQKGINSFRPRSRLDRGLRAFLKTLTKEEKKHMRIRGGTGYLGGLAMFSVLAVGMALVLRRQHRWKKVRKMQERFAENRKATDALYKQMLRQVADSQNNESEKLGNAQEISETDHSGDFTQSLGATATAR